MSGTTTALSMEVLQIGMIGLGRINNLQLRQTRKAFHASTAITRGSTPLGILKTWI
jgi:hypothetical protein